MKLSSELYINKPCGVSSTFLVLLRTEKLSNVISVSGNSLLVLPTTVLVNVFLPKSEFTVPLLAAKSGFSILNPPSSLILPVNISLTNPAAAGNSAEAPKLLYCPLPKKYSPYPFEAVYSFAGKNGMYPTSSEPLYSNLKY